MRFDFTYPVLFVCADGRKHLASEVEMQAEIDIYRTEITALYVRDIEIRGANDWVEVDRGTDGFKLTHEYLLNNKTLMAELYDVLSEERASDRIGRAGDAYMNARKEAVA